jgi:hypothetical protein
MVNTCEKGCMGTFRQNVGAGRRYSATIPIGKKCYIKIVWALRVLLIKNQQPYFVEQPGIIFVDIPERCSAIKLC